jgi:hypothetical protein
VERVGQNEVWIRGKTNMEDYRVGKAYTVRWDIMTRLRRRSVEWARHTQSGGI